MANLQMRAMQGAILGLIGGLVMNLYVTYQGVQYTLLKAIIALWSYITSAIGISGVNVQFSTVNVDLSGSVTGIGGAEFANYFAQVFGVSIPDVAFEVAGIGVSSGFLGAMIGASVVFAVVAMAIEYVNGFRGASSFGRYFYLILGAHVAGLLFFNGIPALNIDTLELAIAFVINAAVVAYLVDMVVDPIYKSLTKRKLVTA